MGGERKQGEEGKGINGWSLCRSPRDSKENEVSLYAVFSWKYLFKNNFLEIALRDRNNRSVDWSLKKRGKVGRRIKNLM